MGVAPYRKTPLSSRTWSQSDCSQVTRSCQDTMRSGQSHGLRLIKFFIASISLVWLAFTAGITGVPDYAE